MNPKYPTRSEILTAIKNPKLSFKDIALKRGEPIKTGIAIEQYTGAFTSVFPFVTDGNKKAIRVWTSEVDSAKERTQKLSEYLLKLNSQYFVKFDYCKEALLICGEFYPIVVMDWVTGINLKKYIGSILKSKSQLLSLAERFKELVTYLHNNNLSHGDLQHGNILVTEKGNLILVDYDSFYVPGMEKFSDTIKGLPGYQHPKRETLKYLSNVSDYFSELVIYLSILTYSEHPEYWQEGTDHLLFSKEDIYEYNSSKIFKQLTKSNSELVRNLTSTLVDFINEDSINHLKPLEVVLVSKKDALLNDYEKEFSNVPPKKNRYSPPKTAKPKIDNFDFETIVKIKVTPPKSTKPDIDIFNDSFIKLPIKNKSGIKKNRPSSDDFTF